MEWISFTQVENWIDKNTEIQTSFDVDGLVGILKNKNAHLDIYDMDRYEPDYNNGSPECKIEDVKDFLAIFFKDWENKFKEIQNWEIK